MRFSTTAIGVASLSTLASAGLLDAASGILGSTVGSLAGQQQSCITPISQIQINLAFSNGGAGTKVQLCQGITVPLTDTITFTAPNQELSTVGYPNDEQRAVLEVTGAAQSTAVTATCNDCSGATVRNLQVNGNRPLLGQIATFSGGLLEVGGATSGQIVRDNKIHDPRGWSCLHVAEGADLSCNNQTIVNNDIGPCGVAPLDAQLVPDLLSLRKWFSLSTRDINFKPGTWADGVSLACQNSHVKNNTITDATDGAIVLFGAPGSQVTQNTIVTDKSDLLGGINCVDLNPYGGNYTNTVVRGNTLKSVGPAIMKNGIAAGAMVWGDSAMNSTQYYTQGASILSNKFESSGAGTIGYAIPVASAFNFTIKGNTFENANFSMARTSACYPDTPDAQALVRNPYASKPGVYQHGFNATSNFQFTLCIARTEQAYLIDAATDSVDSSVTALQQNLALAGSSSA